MDNVDIFLESVKNLQTVGTLAFSSKHLVKKMVSPIQFADARCIIELGTGNGCITKALLKQMKPDAQLLSFEINENFYQMTAKHLHDPRLHLINDSAENMMTHLYNAGFLHADYIVSSVPLVSLPKQVEENILATSLKALKPNGLFIQFSYSTVLLKKIERTFGEKNVKLNFTPLNFPPAFIYVCKHRQ
jgi:phospholipid N-methyltransferase